MRFGRSAGSTTTHNVRQVLGATVTLGHCGVSTSEEGGDWAADDVAATEDDGVAASDGDACVVEKLDDACRGAGREERFACTRGEMTDVVRVESVGGSFVGTWL